MSSKSQSKGTEQQGRREKRPVTRDLVLQYEGHHRALKEARPKRSGAELVSELQELASKLKEASMDFNTTAKTLIARSLEAGCATQANDVKRLRSENNALTRSYLKAINDDLEMADVDLVSNITGTTGTSQFSERSREERRLELYTELQKSKAAREFDRRQESLEQERLGLERERRRQACEDNNRREHLELQRMEREAQIHTVKQRLEKDREEELMEAELAVHSHTGEQLAALDRK